MKKLLFVCGVPRSGTSALAKLLNTSPHVVLGVERYKRLLTLYGKGRPDGVRDRIHGLFRRERLLGDKTPEDSKPFPPAEKGAAMAKWEHATYVGDKVPQLYKRLDTLSAACPEARFICIVRNPYGVAASWQRRADDKDDSWPEENGFARGVEAWNEGLGCALDALESLDGRFVAVQYESLFGGKRGMQQYLALMDWLGFDEGPPVYLYTRLALQDSVRRAAASPPFLGESACIAKAKPTWPPIANWSSGHSARVIKPDDGKVRPIHHHSNRKGVEGGPLGARPSWHGRACGAWKGKTPSPQWSSPRHVAKADAPSDPGGLGRPKKTRMEQMAATQ